MGWPDATEFTEYLQASGLYGLNPSARELLLDLPGALAAGIERWENLTHYWPFLSTGNVNETRYFDPPYGHMLDLDGGLITFSSLATDIFYQSGNTNSQGTDSLSSGTPRVNYLDFRLHPENAANKRRPWTEIHMGWHPAGGPGSISVTGEWGFCNSANLPSAARIAVMALSAQFLLPQIMRALTGGGLIQLQRGDEMKRWPSPKELKEGWEADVKNALAMGDYVRMRMA